jgi:hypothetical protein
MGRMSELAQELAELRHCGEVLIGISDTLTEMFSATVASDEKKTSDTGTRAAKQKTKVAEKADKKELKFSDVRAVLADKSRAGFTKEVKALLAKYGAENLSGVKPEDYEALVAEAEVLGNG